MMQNYTLYLFFSDVLPNTLFWQFLTTISELNLILVFTSSVITISLPLIYFSGKRKLWEAGKIVAGASALGAIEGALNAYIDTKFGGAKSNPESKGGNPDNKTSSPDNNSNSK